MGLHFLRRSRAVGGTLSRSKMASFFKIVLPIVVLVVCERALSYPADCKDKKIGYCFLNKGKCDQAEVAETCPQTCNKCTRGTWSEWGEFSPCSRSCGGGSRSRVRKCLSSNNCAGRRVETQSCNRRPCSSCKDKKIGYCFLNKGKCHEAEVAETCPHTCGKCYYADEAYATPPCQSSDPVCVDICFRGHCHRRCYEDESRTRTCIPQ